MLYNIPFYLKSDAEKVAMLALGITPAVRGIRILALIHFLVYMLFILRKIRMFRNLAREQYSSLSRLKVRWIAYLGFAFSTVLLVNIVPEFSLPVIFDLTKIWEALLILFLGYMGLTRPVLFLNRDFLVDPEKAGQPLQLVDIPVPQPGPGQVLIRVLRAFGIDGVPPHAGERRMGYPVAHVRSRRHARAADPRLRRRRQPPQAAVDGVRRRRGARRVHGAQGLKFGRLFPGPLRDPDSGQLGRRTPEARRLRRDL